MTRDDDAYDDEAHDLWLQERAQRRYHNTLMRHPDTQDPDYPEIDEGEDDEDK